MGSDEISCGFLDALLRAGGLRLRAIVTQPDRPSGRHLRLQPSAVRAMVLDQSMGIDVLTPENVNAPAVVDAIATYRPQVIVVVAYGQFLGRRLLALPPLGCLNMHLSLLPALRGAAPIVRAILNGLEVTGVTAMQMDRGMDSGDILDTCSTPITPADTAASLTERLMLQGRVLMIQTLSAMAGGSAVRTPQDDSLATFAPKIQKDEWLIDWARPAAVVCRTVRAFSPKPACTTFLPPDPTKSMLPNQPGPLLKVLQAEVASEFTSGASPGTVVSMSGSPVVLAGDGIGVRLLEVRPEGRARAINGADFVNGYRVKVREGDRFFPGLTLAVEQCP